jgi:hypothetical protein
LDSCHNGNPESIPQHILVQSFAMICKLHPPITGNESQ